MTFLAYATGAIASIAAGWLVLRRKAVVVEMKYSTEFKALHHGGTRAMAKVKWIVLHSTEGGTARGAAAWFANPASTGSTHVVVGEDGVYRTLSDDVVPYGAPGANENGLHVEMAGYGGWHGSPRSPPWTRAEWLAHDLTLRRAATQAAAWGAQYRIPLRFIDAAGLKRGESGVTTHWEVTKAFNAGKGHIDPGVAFPMDVLMGYAGGHA